jgi:tetratricopeptide (TPR) repeat protein
MGFHEQELLAYGAALPSYRKLLDVIPDSPDYQESIVLTLLDRAQLLLDLSQTREAGADVNEALPIIARLTTRHPNVARYQQELAAGLEAKGRWEHLKEDYLQASDTMRGSIELLDKLSDARIDVPEYRERAAVGRVQLARTWSALGMTSKADTEFDTAFSTLVELRSLAPDYPQFAADMAWLCTQRGGLLWDRGEQAQATKQLQEAVERWTEIEQKWPSPEHTRALVELLANGPVQELRDPQRAVSLARQATEQAPHDALSSVSLGWALYRSGNSREALEVLDKSRASSEPLAQKYLIRALSLHMLGDPAPALQHLDAAIVLQHSCPGDEHLRRLAAETATLLGVRLAN